MVPTSLIMLALVAAFFPGAFAYLFAWPKRRLVNPYFVPLGGSGALMLVTIILAIGDVRIVWLSWVLLAGAILLAARSITLFRRGQQAARAHEREVAARRARGH